MTKKTKQKIKKKVKKIDRKEFVKKYLEASMYYNGLKNVLKEIIEEELGETTERFITDLNIEESVDWYSVVMSLEFGILTNESVIHVRSLIERVRTILEEYGIYITDEFIRIKGDKHTFLFELSFGDVKLVAHLEDIKKKTFEKNYEKYKLKK